MEKEFIPVVDTDEISYKTLAEQNPALLNEIRRFIGNGFSARQVERMMKRTFGTASITVNLAVGAAYYIESGRVGGAK